MQIDITSHFDPLGKVSSLEMLYQAFNAAAIRMKVSGKSVLLSNYRDPNILLYYILYILFSIIYQRNTFLKQMHTQKRK